MGLEPDLFDENRQGGNWRVFSKIAGVSTLGMNSYCLAANC